MNNSILLFDIDYTLFNTDIFRNKIIEETLSQFKLDEKRVRKFYFEYERNINTPVGINIKHFTEEIGKEFNLSPELLFSIMMDRKRLYLESLYPDTITTLTLLSKKYLLGIFSQGYRSFQENKLKQCGIISYFKQEYIFIFPDKTLDSVLKTLPKNAIIIEDKLSVVQLIKFPLRAIHINREDKKSTRILSINNLVGLPSLLKQLP
jgi:phosphoglycolate phosphatase-like HAD superfamily hydrolase